jgi:hypothetical protein
MLAVDDKLRYYAHHTSKYLKVYNTEYIATYNSSMRQQPSSASNNAPSAVVVADSQMLVCYDCTVGTA